MFKPCGTLGGCLKLKKRSAWLYAHSLQNQQTSDTTCAHTTGPSDARQAVELSADVPVHPSGTLGRVPQTEVSERLVLILSPSKKKHVVFNNTYARDS